MSNSSDLLAAETLLVTVVTVVWGIWNPEIAAADAIKEPGLHQNLEDSVATESRAQLTSALRYRALPLATMSLVLSITFAPPILDDIGAALHDIIARGAGAVGDYDPVVAALVAAWGVLVVITAVLLRASQRLRAMRRKYAPPS